MNQRLYQLSDWIASIFRVGYLPFAPGTWGSLVALIVWYFLPELNTLFYLLLVLNYFFIGVITASIVSIIDDLKDPSKIVIDEWVGMWIALFVVPKTWEWMLLSFLLFRMFDIIKPTPVRQLENLKSGWGIMLDDVMAGIYSLIFFKLIYSLV